MRTVSRRFESILLALLLALPAAVPAVDAPDFATHLAALVKSAHQQLGVVRARLGDVEAFAGASSGGRAATGGHGGSILAAGGRGEFTELERSLTALSDTSNDIVQLVSKCSAESHDVAAKFRSQLQRVRSGVSQVESSDNSSMAQMSMSKIRRDLDAAEQQLASVAGLSGNCSG